MAQLALEGPSTIYCRGSQSSFPLPPSSPIPLPFPSPQPRPSDLPNDNPPRISERCYKMRVLMSTLCPIRRYTCPIRRPLSSLLHHNTITSMRRTRSTPPPDSVTALSLVSFWRMWMQVLVAMRELPNVGSPATHRLVRNPSMVLSPRG